MEYSYKFRLYPSKEQETLIQKTFGCVRYVYNYFLAERKRRYEESKETMNFYACNKALTSLKHAPETAWLREPDKNALQYALRDLDTAYKNFFRGIKSGNAVGYPKFKKKHDRHRNYSTPYNGGNVEVFDRSIKLPKLGKVKCRVSREVKGRILNATISQAPSGKYFVSICCTGVELPQLPKTKQNIGVDLGVKKIITLSDGTKIENPKYFQGWWSGYIAQSEFAKEISLDAKVVECEGNPTRFKVGDKVKLSDKAKTEIFPYSLRPVEVGTVIAVCEDLVFVDWKGFYGRYRNSDLVLAEEQK